MMEAAVVIPAYEPDDRLQGYVQALYGAGFAEIVVVDDGSGPAYGPVFDAVRAVAGCVVLSYGENRGKGAALKTGFRYLLEQARRAGRPAPGAVTADCDGQHTVEVPRHGKSARGIDAGLPELWPGHAAAQRHGQPGGQRRNAPSVWN